VSHSGAPAGTLNDADTIPDGKRLAGIDLLDDRDALTTSVEADFDLKPIARCHGLTDMRTDGSTGKCTAHSRGTAPRTTTDLISCKTTDTGTDQGASEGVTLDIHIPDGCDGSELDGLCTARLTS